MHLNARRLEADNMRDSGSDPDQYVNRVCLCEICFQGEEDFICAFAGDHDGSAAGNDDSQISDDSEDASF